MVAVAWPSVATATPSSDCFGATVRPYRVVDLGAVGPVGAVLTELGLPLGGPHTFGVNVHLETVWFAVTATDPALEVRAFVHLPAARYGLAAGTHELPIPSGAPGGGAVAAALDINDDGVIVGFVGEVIFQEADKETRAFVWRLDQASSQSPPAIPDGEEIDLTSLTAVGCYSAAFAVTDDAPLTVVGTAQWSICPCVKRGLGLVATRGFMVELDDPETALSLTGAGGSVAWSFAVTPDAGEFDLDRIVVGRDGDDGPPPELCIDFGSEVPCPGTDPSDFDGTAWDSEGDAISLGKPSAAASAAAYGTDNAGHIVGTAGCDSEPLPPAAFWESATAMDVIDLSAVCGVEQQGRATDVVTIFEPTSEDEIVIAVGGDGQDGARIWGRRGGPTCQWCCHLLDDLILPPLGADQDTVYTIEFAHALARSGQIIAHGFNLDDTSTVRVLMLTCSADLDGDHRVNSTDLGLLLLAAPSCPTSGPCDADLDGDGLVGSSDLGLLLQRWSGTELCTIRPAGGGCAESFGAASGASATDAAIAAISFLGFATMAEFGIWFSNATPLERDGAIEVLRVVFAASLQQESGQ